MDQKRLACAKRRSNHFTISQGARSSKDGESREAAFLESNKGNNR